MLSKFFKIIFLIVMTFIFLNINAKTISLINKEISVSIDSKKDFKLGIMPQKDKTVLLEITSRVQRNSFAGSMPMLTIVVNGKEVRPSQTRKAARLVNKPLISMVSETKRRSWFAENYAWRVLYAPDFEGARQFKFYEGDPYTLLLDITDLVTPAAENLIEIRNRVDLKNWRWKNYIKAGEGALIVKTLNIHIKNGGSPMLVSASVMKPFINKGEPAAGPAKYTAEVMPGGGFVIYDGKTKWKFESIFSYPNAGLKHLLPNEKNSINNTSGWKMEIKRQNNGADILVKGPYYELNRRINFTPCRIEVKDTLTNMQKTALGLFISHKMNTKGVNITGVRLAGNPDPAVNEYSAPANPSVYVELANRGIGMICNDDVFRAQAVLFCETSATGIRTERFRLGPRESYTLEWAVYPVEGPDYFDFVNLVRKDWGANYTLVGPYTLYNPEWILSQPKERLKKLFSYQGIRYAIVNGEWRRGGKNRRSAFGNGGMEPEWEEHRQRHRKAAAIIHEVAPQVKIMVYFNSRLDSSKGCHERFRDSWWTTANGKQKHTDFGFKGNDCYSFIPTLKNSYGKAMLKAIDYFIAETDSDGLYRDEVEGGGFNDLGTTYNMFDGHTCLLDLKTYTIKREIGSVGLLLEKFNLAVAKKISGKGMPLLGNGAITTRATLKMKLQRMTETQFNDFWCYESNLGSPLGWTYTAGSDFKATTRTISLGCLPVGVPLSSTHEISRYLFPFTPIELHHGYLLGEERIITLHDGNYGWVGKRGLVQLRHFNKDGILVKDNSPTLINKEARTAIKLAAGEAMVLVRTPLEFEPAAGTAKASGLSYAKDTISLRLDAPQGGVLKVNSGKFPLKNGTTVKVSLADKVQSLKVKNNNLHISIPSRFCADISIKR